VYTRKRIFFGESSLRTRLSSFVFLLFASGCHLIAGYDDPSSPTDLGSPRDGMLDGASRDLSSIGDGSRDTPSGDGQAGDGQAGDGQAGDGQAGDGATVADAGCQPAADVSVQPWVERTTGAGDEVFSAAAIDENGDVCAVGYATDQARIAQTTPRAFGVWQRSILIACFRADGQLSWSQQVGNSGGIKGVNEAVDVVFTRRGGRRRLVIIGNASHSLLVPSGATIEGNSSWSSQAGFMATIALDCDSGSRPGQWKRLVVYSGTQNGKVETRAVAIDPNSDGAPVVVGRFDRTVQVFAPSADANGRLGLFVGYDARDPFVIVQSAGDLSPSDIVLDPLSGTYISGTYRGDVFFPGLRNLSSPSNQDGFVFGLLVDKSAGWSWSVRWVASLEGQTDAAGNDGSMGDLIEAIGYVYVMASGVGGEVGLYDGRQEYSRLTSDHTVLRLEGTRGLYGGQWETMPGLRSFFRRGNQYAFGGHVSVNRTLGNCTLNPIGGPAASWLRSQSPRPSTCSKSWTMRAATGSSACNRVTLDANGGLVAAGEATGAASLMGKTLSGGAGLDAFVGYFQ
jgi:hypothetical protein